MEVVVVGGGPCGLTAALGAARTGRQVALFEASGVVGGMAASFEVDGQRVDHGSHRLHPLAAPAVRALLDELLGPDLQVRRRNGRLHLAGRWVAFPLRAGDLLRTVPPHVGGRIVADLIAAPLRRRGDDSYAEFVRAGLGPTVLAKFHGPMAEKLWGRPATELSSVLARRRIAVSDGFGLLRRIARGSRPAGRTFLYPRLGYGEVVDRLAVAARSAGATIETGAVIRRVDPGCPARITFDDGRTIEAGTLLWTAPLQSLAMVVGGAPTPSLEHRGLALVYLTLDEDRYSDVDAYYVPDTDIAFARLSEPKNYRSGPDPIGRTVLCAEVPVTVGDRRWTASDEELGATVVDGMARIGLRRPAPSGVTVRRLPRVYPLLGIDDDGRGASLAWADRLPGVAVLGRQGRHVADNLHHVMDMALTAVGCLGDDGWDQRGWAQACGRFDEFVVDD